MSNFTPILPGKTIGLLGGGQLGRMLAMEGKRMGYQVICLDPTPASPCGQVSDEQIIGSFEDLESARKVAERSDVLIYETENINAQVVKELEKSHWVPQSSKILSYFQDRREEKTRLAMAGFPVVPYRITEKSAEIPALIDELGCPCILKTALGGYDGKGQWVIREKSQWDEIRHEIKDGQWVLEKMMNLTTELSVIVARTPDGSTRSFPAAENIHQHQILRASIVPPRIAPEIVAEAQDIAERITEHFKVVGLLAVEFFLVGDKVYVNEMAPRPHNSGHYTWEACYTSQFEQLIRAVCGLPLGPVDLSFPVVMVNILGEDYDKLEALIPHLSEEVKLHIYGKKEMAFRRKVGHLTIKTDKPTEFLADLTEKMGWDPIV
ncbi:5-(carboxyamino)imidazole ribonucleotide synthase [Heliorestis acidaminivorans]|uniref:N5-carboxyaminoimidazole ribonucleotide synthase n=1 Tax=Heliorestis acidaminivorans TaxID=553427 RepID=A0A6I0ERZ3_9FIRM|nr:5-(carboxyamino)imidazole ribonucleotide synthase [Heliorestis acidaminivorans]KAB2953260.1 5-(carboxyamino)imidazole ribonucleotide synthase [Heliorestis acidaminivorans]